MKLIWGVNPILRYLREEWGWRICRQHLWRLSRRRKDPFPVTVRLRSKRAATCASPKQLNAWMKRNHRAVVAPPVPITGEVDLILFEET